MNPSNMTPPLSFSEYVQRIIDSNLKDWGSIEYYESLTKEQTDIVQALKRYKKRITK